jgi:hypothetical protein
MIAAQLLAAHNATMECYRRAMIPEQTVEGRSEKRKDERPDNNSLWRPSRGLSVGCRGRWIHERYDHCDGPRRIGLRPCDGRQGQERGSACCQMQKLTAPESHGVPSSDDGDHRRISIDFRNARPPTAPTLPLIGGTTAGPAGSSQIKLHRLPVCPEGGWAGNGAVPPNAARRFASGLQRTVMAASPLGTNSDPRALVFVDASGASAAARSAPRPWTPLLRVRST